ncbi:c-type cytochrome [Alicycliphilus denitrificans]|uniref:c-type cytochrome n=1 Tax=Alicycliphilus denitrificans TaxID=179636 RepID=UPI0038515146
MAGSTDALGARTLAACALLWLQPGAAQPPISPQDTALLAGNCVTCHGPGGQPPAGADTSIPGLRGQSSAALLERMQAFQAGRVAGATVMPLLMQGYDVAQMQALARWFAKPPAERP